MKKLFTILFLSFSIAGISQNLGDEYWSDAALAKAKVLKKIMYPAKTIDTTVHRKAAAWCATIVSGYTMSNHSIDSIIHLDPIYMAWRRKIGAAPVNCFPDSILNAFRRQVNK